MEYGSAWTYFLGWAQNLTTLHIWDGAGQLARGAAKEATSPFDTKNRRVR